MTADLWRPYESRADMADDPEDMADNGVDEQQEQRLQDLLANLSPDELAEISALAEAMNADGGQ